MRRFNQILAPCLVFLLLAPSTPLYARTRKGDKFLAQAKTAETRSDYDKALGFAEQAAAEDPTDAAYMIELRRLRFLASTYHVKQGQKIRSAGKIEEALAEFQKAYGIDPSSDIAVQEIQRTKAMIERNKNAANPEAAAKPAPPPGGLTEDEKSLTPADLAHKRAIDRAESMLAMPELRPLSQDPINLKMSNKPRVLFETLGRVAGVNVLFDPEYDSQQQIRTQSIDLVNTTLDQALDQLALTSKSFWKALSPNTIFITMDNAQKRREYEEHLVRIFYLSNVTTPQELQEMQTVLRTVIDVSKVFPYSSQNALIVRAEADKMALAEKIISDLDKPRSEVLVDVMVLEASSTYIRNLSSTIAPAGLNATATFTPRSSITSAATTSSSSTTTTTTSTSSTSTSVPLSQLGHISSADYAITGLPSATLQAVLTASGTKILQHPQLRGVANQKTSLKIGDRVPTASGSYQPGVGSVGVNALVNTQFTYLDVGVNFEITPFIHDGTEVSLHLDMDVSQVKDRIDIGGISQPEIAQHKVTQDVRLREGEMSIIGGLIQEQDSKSKAGIPWLSSIPIFGHLFATDNIEKDRTELIIVLIPHIIRGPDVTESNLKSTASGNSTVFKVSYAPRKTAPAVEKKDAATPAAPPATAPPATAPPMAAAPAPASTVMAAPGLAPAMALAPPATAPPDNTSPSISGPVRVSFTPPVMEATLGSTVTVTLYAENVTDLAGAGARLQFDPRFLRVQNIVAGDLPQRNGSQLQPQKNILNDTGTADFSVSRNPQDPGVSGSGNLFTVVFQALGRGNTQVSVMNLAVQTASRQPVNVTGPPPLVVNVK